MAGPTAGTSRVWLLAIPVFWQFLYARRHSALPALGHAPDLTP